MPKIKHGYISCWNFFLIKGMNGYFRDEDEKYPDIVINNGI